jgi:predicted TPR repeat methyltransferase
MTIAEVLALAVQAQQNGQFDEAREIYRRVLEAWPECPDALHFSGLLAFRKGQTEEAIDLIEASLRQVPTHPDFWNNFGNVLKAVGKPEDATIAYRNALQFRPDFAAAHNNLGVMANLRDDFADAAAHFQSAIALQPQNADAHLNLGNAFAGLERIEDAIAAYRIATDLRPADPEAYGRLGHLLWEQGRMDEAAEAIGRNINLTPGDPKGFVVLAGIFYTQGRHDESFQAYAKAVELAPTDSHSNFLFGQTLTHHGQPEAAREVWRKWSEADPENPVPRHLLAAGTDDEVPERSGDDFVVRVFDNFAESFDQKLKKLDYRAPELVAEALRRLIPEPAGNLDILDAGCGTGLCGPLLRPFARRLDGVDLSPKMLAKAKLRADYDELAAAELTAFISERKQAYDVVVSADTLCYFGTLETVLTATTESLRPGGRFIFTVERTPPSKAAERVTLEQTGRYTHTESYVRSALATAGLSVTELTTVTLRMEYFKPVEGMLVTATK